VSERFVGSTALVTGAGSGIGRAIAQRLAADGAKVYILDLTEQAAEDTAALIESERGGEATPLTCDVGDTASVTQAFSGLGRLDILVNSAGVAHVGTLEHTPPEDLDRLYRVNVKGTYHCMQAALPLLRKSKNASILNLASIASKIGIVDRFAYSMSKGAVLSMTLSVARDYVREGIRCNCLCPARIHTPFVDGYLEKNYPNDKERMFRQLSDYQPIGRMGTSEEVAALAAFLCSSEASYITGAAYDLDGGVVSLR